MPSKGAQNKLFLFLYRKRQRDTQETRTSVSSNFIPQLLCSFSFVAVAQTPFSQQWP